MKFVQGNGLNQAIRNVVAKGPCDIAVAFWGIQAVEVLELPTKLDGYRIACDAMSGCVSPYAIGKMLERGASVRDVTALHAKVYKSPNAMVVTSANASTNGLLGDARSDMGLEAGVIVTSEEELAAAANWLDRVFASGSAVGPKDLPEICELWNQQRLRRPARQSLTEAILSRSDDLTDRDIRVVCYAAEEPSGRVARIYKETPYFDKKKWNESSVYPFYFGEWQKVKAEDMLLTFAVDGSKITCDGVWKILDEIGEGDDKVWPAVLVKRPLGRKLGKVREINRRVLAAIREERLAPNNEPMTLLDFAQAL